jgi:aminomethyltransferase
MSTALQDNPPGTAELGDLQAEFRALVAGCGVYESSSRLKLVLSGKDRVRWLNGMVTNNIRDLASGRGVYAFVLNPQGHIVGDLYAFNRGESLILDTDQAQAEKLQATFRRYIIMDKVELVDAGGQLTSVGISGPKAQQVLAKTGIEFADLSPLELVELTWRDTPLIVVRSDNPGVATFELWVTPGQAAALQEELSKAGATPVGEAALELLRIASGIPRYGKDIRERDLPQETEQERALSFTKGCYIGQEIVERIRSRGAVHRRFTGFLMEGDLPPIGTKIQLDGKDVGEVTSAASLPAPNGARLVALGFIRREAAASGKPLNAGGANLRVSATPFADIFQD